jgi:hypothetical protein
MGVLFLVGAQYFCASPTQFKKLIKVYEWCIIFQKICRKILDYFKISQFIVDKINEI